MYSLFVQNIIPVIIIDAIKMYRYYWERHLTLWSSKNSYRVDLERLYFLQNKQRGRLIARRDHEGHNWRTTVRHVLLRTSTHYRSTQKVILRDRDGLSIKPIHESAVLSSFRMILGVYTWKVQRLLNPSFLFIVKKELSVKKLKSISFAYIIGT